MDGLKVSVAEYFRATIELEFMVAGFPLKLTGTMGCSNFVNTDKSSRSSKKSDLLYLHI